MAEELSYDSRQPDRSPVADRGCPKCGGTMGPGFHLDPRPSPSGRRQLLWIEGLPEKNFWTGITVSGRLNLPVITFRCRTCDYLEAYAPSITQA
jgi:hypothetical protein